MPAQQLPGKMLCCSWKSNCISIAVTNSLMKSSRLVSWSDLTCWNWNLFSSCINQTQLVFGFAFFIEDELDDKLNWYLYSAQQESILRCVLLAVFVVDISSNKITEGHCCFFTQKILSIWRVLILLHVEFADNGIIGVSL